jgi:hypothetical protein
LRAALTQWALFDSPSAVHLDLAAPAISGPNVPRPSDGHAESVVRYFRRRMGEPFDLQL